MLDGWLMNLGCQVGRHNNIFRRLAATIRFLTSALICSISFSCLIMTNYCLHDGIPTQSSAGV